jgi:hypothetical protein
VLWPLLSADTSCSCGRRHLSADIRRQSYAADIRRLRWQHALVGGLFGGDTPRGRRACSPDHEACGSRFICRQVVLSLTAQQGHRGNRGYRFLPGPRLRTRAGAPLCRDRCGRWCNGLLLNVFDRHRAGLQVGALQVLLGAEVVVDPHAGPYAVGVSVAKWALAALASVVASQALLAGEGSPVEVEPVAGALQTRKTAYLALVVHEGVLYRQTSPVKAWFVVWEAKDRSWCLWSQLSPLRRGFLRLSPV